MSTLLEASSVNWFRCQAEYFRHRKTLRIVRRLGEVGALYPLKLWGWAVEQSVSGSLRDIDAEELAMICGFSGDPAVLWSAMVDCGFIETEDGESRIHSWEEHQGKLIERAERNAERMRAARSRNVPDTSLATDETNGRNETDERTETEPSAPVEEIELPDPLRTNTFRAAWADWHAYRRERKLGKWASRTVKTKLAELAAMGEPAAVQSIRESIGNGWSGLFPPKAARPAFVDRQAALIAANQAGGKIETRQEIPTATRLANLAASLPEGLANCVNWRLRILKLRDLEPESAERELSKMDAELLATLRSRLQPGKSGEIDRKVNASRSRFASRISAEELEETCDRLRASLIREHFGIPVLSLFSEEAKAA